VNPRIRVAQIDRNSAGVIFGAVDAILVIEQALHCIPQHLGVGVNDRHVVQASVAGGGVPFALIQVFSAMWWW
jgi:hypothetical protein